MITKLELESGKKQPIVKVDRRVLTLQGRRKARALADKLCGKPQFFRMDWEADTEAFPLPNSFAFETKQQAKAFYEGMHEIFEEEDDLLEEFKGES